MKSRACVFNGFLWVLVLALVAGCGTPEERKHRKERSTVRIHVQSDSSTDKSSAVSIIRSAPMMLNIEREAVLDESHVLAAMVVDQPGGHAIEIHFNQRGSWLLEHTSVASRGKHLAIFAQFGPSRWLAAPLITGKNTGGRLRFTPDATREESERFVRGLNNLVHKMERRENWPFPAPMGQ